MTSIHQRGHAEIEANLTPMIDMTFLLIVFFILISQITEIENIEMELPQPKPAASSPPPEETRSVINIIPDAEGKAVGYKLGTVTYSIEPGGAAALRDELVKMYGANPELRINLRADRRTEQRWVDPILEAIRTAASTAGGGADARVNLVVVEKRGR